MFEGQGERWLVQAFPHAAPNQTVIGKYRIVDHIPRPSGKKRANQRDPALST